MGPNSVHCHGCTTGSLREKIRLTPPLLSSSSPSTHLLLSHKRKSSQDTFSDRDGTSSGRRPFQGKDESLFRFSDPEEAARLVLEEQRDYLLAEAKSEILKQECKVDTLNTCIREFQRQAHSHRLELDSVSCWYEESGREQAPQHEELALREKALRETRIRNIHEVDN